ncbi:hypothetical protein NM688_g6130 [Phlebia brevispora]|uniref:Uncharacterized protein n=1 Tax=Phlebia brevispora TaxID=194682 RepID=A0ACC1SJM1_9APHY|nr:hypothetical protein NM688_g6130 [Phlebia brevispora]
MFARVSYSHLLRPTLQASFCTSTRLRMPSSDPNATNASGLKPTETKSLKERQAEPHESEIIQSIKELYTCKPSEKTYSVYAQNAVFHDPIGIANGLESIRAQFNGLVKVHLADSLSYGLCLPKVPPCLQIFPRADIPHFRVLENPTSVPKSTILIDQDVSYFRDPNASSPTKASYMTINSLLTIETNEAHKIVRHTEEWDHKHEPTSDDGFLGMLNEQRKKLTAGITEKFVSQEPPENA